MSQAVLYGLGVDADFDLHQAAAEGEDISDVVVRTGQSFDEWLPQPYGEQLLDFATSEPWYTLVRTNDGDFHFRVHSVCDYRISADLSSVELLMHSAVRPGMDGVMTTGTLLSLLLYLRGAPVFHGSAVEVNDQAIGFVGHSGQGKTTMATLFCSEGASVITDDVLVIDDAAHEPRVRRGSRELRLRAGIEQLAAKVDGSTSRVSADDRQVIAPRHSESSSVPLRALVIPRPTRDGAPMRFERLGHKDAVFALLAFPRLMGWRDRGVLADIFRDASALAARVPVVVAHMPWGPPFPERVTEALLGALDS